MEVLELKPLKKKTLTLILVESEFPIDWWFDAPAQENHDILWNLQIISTEYLRVIEDLIEKYEPNFVVEEKGSRWDDTIPDDDPLVALFRERNIPYLKVDISENAEGYLSAALDSHRTLLKQISTKIKNMIKNELSNPVNDYNLENLVVWKEYLQQEYNEREDEVRYKVREAWMMMKILAFGSEQEDKKLKALFLCDSRHFEGINQLAEELGIETEIIKIKKAALITNNSGNSSLEDFLNKSMLEITPIKVKKKDDLDKICYFFDTDDNASPFDINMAYDAGFDIVIPISKMTADQVPKLVQDAIFSRKPKAPTTFFIGGAKVKEAEKIAKKVMKSLVPPFECPVIVDPRGSHTTASAIVAKTMEIAQEHGIDSLEGKKVLIMGAGPVAKIAAILAARLKCKTLIIETWDKSTEEYVKTLTKELTQEAGKNATIIEGIYAPKEEQRYNIVKDADIIWSLAGAGVEVLSEKIMANLEGKKLIVDINLVPPYGIKGLKPKDNNKEIYPEIYGLGALVLGHLKSNIEASILKEAANTKGKKIFDYNYAFDIAKKILFGKKVEILQFISE
ncbi:MAG: methylene-tetrahydromethanopterin dehydrogenase N-terminal domain-containing protein [Candidatus Hodarchaeota archaeon]